MANLSALEARVAAATQCLAGQHGQAQEWQDKVLELQDELTRSRADFGRLQGELAKTSDEKSKLEEQLETIRGENRRLINDAARNRDEIARLETDRSELCQESERLTALLDSLVQAVESHGGEQVKAKHDEAEAKPEPAGAIQLAQPLGEVCPLPRPEGQASQPGWLATGSIKPANAHGDADNDIPNEAARRLMDRIRERIEAHHRA